MDVWQGWDHGADDPRGASVKALGRGADLKAGKMFHGGQAASNQGRGGSKVEVKAITFQSSDRERGHLLGRRAGGVRELPRDCGLGLTRPRPRFLSSRHLRAA